MLNTRRQNPVLTPFDQLNRLSEEMDRLFGAAWTGAEPYQENVGAWMPPMDIQETADDVRCILEVPGVARDDIEITVNSNVLTITGEKRRSEGENARLFRTERRYGRFTRAITLPSTVDANAVRASYADGVLTLTLPKAAEAKPRRIEIESGERRQIEG